MNARHFFKPTSSDVPSPIDVEAHLGAFVRSGPIAFTVRPETRDITAKRDALFREFSGQPQLCYFHAVAIAHIRRNHEQERALSDFFSLWDGASEFLLRHLDLRWLVSACDTFADHGRTPQERGLGFLGSAVANICKLYETERHLTQAGGTADEKALTRSTGVVQSAPGPVPLFDGLSRFSVGRGDMIRNLLERMDRLLTDTSGESCVSALVNEVKIRLLAHDTVFQRFAGRHQLPSRHPWFATGRRIALFNDTSKSHHFGCETIMAVLQELLEARGANIIYRHRVGKDWTEDPIAARAIEQCDVVVVNGEGSIHHGSARAKNLSQLGPYCRKMGKPAYLINATLQANDADTYAAIADFTGIWVRETGSSQELHQVGIPHSICPDLSIIAAYPKDTEVNSDVLFVDSVRPAISGAIAGLRRDARERVVSMKWDGATKSCLGFEGAPPEDGLIRQRDHFRPLVPCETTAEFARLIARHRRMITGRYHAACMAIAMGVPFHAFASNTFKIQAMLADIGLDPRRMLTLKSSMPEHLPYSDDELTALELYRQRTRARADRMMTEILWL